MAIENWCYFSAIDTHFEKDMTGKNTLPKSANIILEQMWGVANLDFN